MSSEEKRTCPCKRLPLYLSSFTAAEYGDTHAISRLGPAAANRTDAGGYTPLHLAAQNGHVAATSFLLEIGANVDGVGGCGATPLHRASYAGAVSTMQILLEKDGDLLARDTSFGDKMTPLHKAAAGGRYLAVQLLLDALRTRSPTESHGNGISSSMMEQGLKARDSQGRTPFIVAKEYVGNQEQEEKSVQRWDAVAGGPADWARCADLLRCAEQELVADSSLIEGTSSLDGKRFPPNQRLPPVPQHLTNPSSCLECSATSDGTCLTASWETAFRSVLATTVDRKLQSADHSEVQVATNEDTDEPAVAPSKSSHVQTSLNETESRESEDMSGSQPALGRNCHACGVASFALHQEGDKLVCRKCAKPVRRRRMNL